MNPASTNDVAKTGCRIAYGISTVSTTWITPLD